MELNEDQKRDCVLLDLLTLAKVHGISSRRCYYYKGLLSSLPSSSTPTPQLMVLTKSENKFDGFFHVFEEVSTVVCPINQRINSPKNSEKCRKSGEAFLSFSLSLFWSEWEKKIPIIGHRKSNCFTNF